MLSHEDAKELNDLAIDAAKAYCATQMARLRAEVAPDDPDTPAIAAEATSNFLMATLALSACLARHTVEWAQAHEGSPEVNAAKAEINASVILGAI